MNFAWKSETTQNLVLLSYKVLHSLNHITAFSRWFPIYPGRFWTDLSQNQGAFIGRTKSEKGLVKFIVWYKNLQKEIISVFVDIEWGCNPMPQRLGWIGMRFYDATWKSSKSISTTNHLGLAERSCTRSIKLNENASVSHLPRVDGVESSPPNKCDLDLRPVTLTTFNLDLCDLDLWPLFLILGWKPDFLHFWPFWTRPMTFELVQDMMVLYVCAKL